MSKISRETLEDLVKALYTIGLTKEEIRELLMEVCNIDKLEEFSKFIQDMEWASGHIVRRLLELEGGQNDS